MKNDAMMPDVMAEIDTISDIINTNTQNRGAILNEEQQLYDINKEDRLTVTSKRTRGVDVNDRNY